MLDKSAITIPALALMFSDEDLWGLYSVIQHGQVTGYFKEPENLPWAVDMQDKISQARELRRRAFRIGG